MFLDFLGNNFIHTVLFCFALIAIFTLIKLGFKAFFNILILYIAWFIARKFLFKVYASTVPVYDFKVVCLIEIIGILAVVFYVYHLLKKFKATKKEKKES